MRHPKVGFAQFLGQRFLTTIEFLESGTTSLDDKFTRILVFGLAHTSASRVWHERISPSIISGKKSSYNVRGSGTSGAPSLWDGSRIESSLYGFHVEVSGAILLLVCSAKAGPGWKWDGVVHVLS